METCSKCGMQLANGLCSGCQMSADQCTCQPAAGTPAADTTPVIGEAADTTGAATDTTPQV